MPQSEYTKEHGRTGTQFYGNKIHTGEWVMALAGISRSSTVDRMRTDAIIAAIENGYILPIKQANTRFDYDDKDAQKDSKLLDILEFVKQNFARINTSQALAQSALCIPYGHSLLEQIYEVKDGKLWLKKLAHRMQNTVYKWYIEDGEFNGIQQQVWVPQDKGAYSSVEYLDIPAYKLVLVTHKLEGSNFEGSSEYRSFYREYLLKDKTLKQLAITIERVGGGIPYAVISNDAPESAKNADGSVATKGAVEQVEEVLQGMMGSENAYAVMKWVVREGFWTLHPDSVSKMQELIKYFDETMAKSASQLFVNLGTSATGSRALGTTFEDLYYQALIGNATEITSAWNDQLIKRMIQINFGPQTIYPKMSLTLEKDLAPILTLYATLKEKGLISGNTDFENWINDWYGLPATTKENKLMSVSAAIVPVAPTSLSGCSCGDSMKLSEGKQVFAAQRKPTEQESLILNLSEITEQVETLVRGLAQDLRSDVQPAIDNAAKDLGKGEKIYNVKIGFGNRVADLFRKYYLKLLKIGRADVRKELNKQNGKKFSEYQFDDTRIQAEADFEKWVNEQANIDSELLNSGVRQAVARYYRTAINEGLQGTALSRFIIDAFIAEVGQRYDAAANSLTGAYGMVREVAVDEIKDMISGKVRTEIFDSHICDYCREQDGAKYRYNKEADDYIGDNGEPAPDLPDPLCQGTLGGNSCRGMYLYLME